MKCADATTQDHISVIARKNKNGAYSCTKHANQCNFMKNNRQSFSKPPKYRRNRLVDQKPFYVTIVAAGVPVKLKLPKAKHNSEKKPTKQKR